ncbi:TPA: hypothetical protein NIJ01_006212 [Pseudomonas aeruginosa]|nr:hypothetical protein [Pseudomonas aeruginosa]
MSNELTDVRCHCGAEFPADSYDAGFIAGSGMCQNCDAAMPPKDIPALVDQAGGDERAAFEAAFAAMGRPVCRADYDQDAYGTPFDDGGWTGWQARAALAQPYPKSGDYSDQSWINAGCPPEQPEQAEAERPEVVGYLGRRIGMSEPGFHRSAEDAGYPGPGRKALIDLEQHDRIVGALRAKIAQLRQHKNDYMDAGQETYRALQNEIREREAEIARLDGLVSGRTAERDAALARVAELERGKVYVEARQCDECQHGGINDSATGVAACHECDWTGPEPEEDRCPGCQRENCMAAACPQCGARYVLVASEEIAAPVAQAQHSVPGNAAALVRAEAKKYSLNAAGMLDSGAPEHAQTFAIVQLLSEFDDEEAERHWEAIMAYSDFRTSDALFRAAELLAAAPGKEGV